MHANYTVRNRRNRRIMRHDHHCRALLAAHVLQNAEHLLAGVVVKRAGRFVTQQNLRILRHRSSDRHTLLLAARQLRGKIVDAVRKPYVGERLSGVLCVGNDL